MSFSLYYTEPQSLFWQRLKIGVGQRVAGRGGEQGGSHFRFPISDCVLRDSGRLAGSWGLSAPEGSVGVWEWGSVGVWVCGCVGAGVEAGAGFRVAGSGWFGHASRITDDASGSG